MAHAGPGLVEAFEAAGRGDAANLSQLLDTGVDVNASLFGSRMLHVTAGAGHLNVISLLLDRGADPKIATTEGSQTPLHVAALYGCRDAAAALLGASVAVNPKADNNATPLHMAADKGHLDVVRLLVEQDAMVDAPNADGWTALFWASSSGHAEIVKYLLALGANAHVVRDQVAVYSAAPRGGTRSCGHGRPSGWRWRSGQPQGVQRRYTATLRSSGWPCRCFQTVAGSRCGYARGDEQGRHSIRTGPVIQHARRHSGKTEMSFGTKRSTHSRRIFDACPRRHNIRAAS